jgi:hypothetical protein
MIMLANTGRKKGNIAKDKIRTKRIRGSLSKLVPLRTSQYKLVKG